MPGKNIMKDNFNPHPESMIIDLIRPFTNSVTKKIAPLHGSDETLS